MAITSPGPKRASEHFGLLLQLAEADPPLAFDEGGRSGAAGEDRGERFP
jgi:hypothetical protein